MCNISGRNQDGRDGVPALAVCSFGYEHFVARFLDGAGMRILGAIFATPILRNITVKKWGVDGIVYTDAGALGLLVTQHKRYSDLRAAAAAALKAGINMVLPIRDDYIGAVKGALAPKLLTEADLHAVLRGSLRTTFRLGLLDPPEVVPFTRFKAASIPATSACR